MHGTNSVARLSTSRRCPWYEAGVLECQDIHTIELLEDALYGAGTAAASHGDIELVLVVVGHDDVIGLGG